MKPSSERLENCPKSTQPERCRVCIQTRVFPSFMTTSFLPCLVMTSLLSSLITSQSQDSSFHSYPLGHHGGKVSFTPGLYFLGILEELLMLPPSYSTDLPSRRTLILPLLTPTQTQYLHILIGVSQFLIQI